MTTTSPGWFPAWPAGFPDIQAAYESTCPHQYPEGLYTEGTDEYLDILAEARILSWVRQGGEWILRRFFPHLDSLGQFQGFWEEMLGIAKRATVELRQSAILSYLRYNIGTATKASVQAIFAPVFGLDDPERIAFSFPTYAEVAATNPTTDQEWADALNKLHIYDIRELAAPDPAQFADAARAIKPTWQIWTGGQYEAALYDTQGAYNEGVYS
jgi:hypothetical protein